MKKTILISILTLIIASWVIIRIVGLKFYRTPTSAMENTLPVGTTLMGWDKQFEPERFEIIVYHSPDCDTVTVPYSSISYYALKRFMKKDEFESQYASAYVPLKDRDRRIGRCVALPGDKIKMIDSELFINGELYKNADVKKSYLLKIKHGERINARFWQSNHIKAEDITNMGEFLNINLTADQVAKISQLPFVESLKVNIDNRQGNLDIFPHSEKMPFTRDLFGPFEMPQKGKAIELTLGNLPLYSRLITAYEQNDLKVVDNNIFINEIKTKSYTPQMNYYLIIGDNRDYCIDSRYYGFLPENHICGRILHIFK